MLKNNKKSLGIKRNKLLRYQTILNYYHKVKAENRYITIVELHRDFIYPKFHISRVTLYNILGTPVKRELEKVEALLSEEAKKSLF